MTAALARRVGSRAAAAALAVILGAAYMMLGAGTASAQPRQLVCTIGGGPLTAPVALTEGEQVQLVVVVPLLGTRVKVGPTQTATPGTEVLSTAVEGVVGLVNGLCQVAVQVQTAASSAVPMPLPPVALPTLPPMMPSQSVQLPLPGVGVSVDTGGGTAPGTGGPAPDSPGPSQPSTSPPLTTPGSPNGSIPGYRFDQGRIPLYDLSSVPYGVSTRFGPAAAPAFRFGQRVPGYAPQFGILGADGTNSDVAAAGRVQALPLGGPTAVALPVLLAVLMLSTVSGALVRTWTLRRAV